MPDIEQIFRDYVTEHRAGDEANPQAFLAQAEGAERTELAALIDAYLAQSPGKTWDAAAFPGSPAERVTEQIAAGWDLEEDEAQQGWRVLLPALRNRARVMRREVVERLAQGLGHPAESQQVAAYYHRMELGQLPAEGVSNRVLDVLGEILGESGERLREAGTAAVGSMFGDDSVDLAYARTARQDALYQRSVLADAEDLAAAEASPAQPSEIDRLFTGGPDAT